MNPSHDFDGSLDLASAADELVAVGPVLIACEAAVLGSRLAVSGTVYELEDVYGGKPSWLRTVQSLIKLPAAIC